MALSDTNKARIQALYDYIVTGLKQRYGEEVELEGVKFATDEAGKVTSMLVQVNTETPPDVDGDTVHHRKQVEVW